MFTAEVAEDAEGNGFRISGARLSGRERRGWRYAARMRRGLLLRLFTVPDESGRRWGLWRLLAAEFRLRSRATRALVLGSCAFNLVVSAAFVILMGYLLVDPRVRISEALPDWEWELLQMILILLATAAWLLLIVRHIVGFNVRHIPATKGVCPACTYPLPAGDVRHLARCPECGGVWSLAGPASASGRFLARARASLEFQKPRRE